MNIPPFEAFDLLGLLRLLYDGQRETHRLLGILVTHGEQTMATINQLVATATAQHDVLVTLHTEHVASLAREDAAIEAWKAAVAQLQSSGTVPDSVITQMNADIAVATADAAAAKAKVPDLPPAPPATAASITIS